MAEDLDLGSFREDDDGRIKGSAGRRYFSPSEMVRIRALKAKQAAQMFEDCVHGMYIKDIAKEFEVSTETVRRRLAEHVPRMLEKDGTKFRALEIHKLDDLERRTDEIIGKTHYTVSHGKVIYMEDPETGESIPLEDSEPILKAIQTKLRIAERRARLLGLDKPHQSEVRVKNEVPDDRRLVDMLENVRRRQREEEARLRGIESAEVVDAEVVENPSEEG